MTPAYCDVLCGGAITRTQIDEKLLGKTQSTNSPLNVLLDMFSIHLLIEVKTLKELIERTSRHTICMMI